MIMKYLLLPVFIIISAGFSLRAAQYSGIVFDIETGEPVAGAYIKFFGTGKEVVSEKDGGVYFDLPDNRIIRYEVIASGYHNLKDSLVPPFMEFIDFPLTPIVYQPGGVTVFSRHFDSELDRISERANSLRDDEIDREISTSLAESVTRLAGVSVRSMGPAPARPVVNGMSGSRVQINKDNIKVNDLSATSPDHAVTVEPFTGERFELIRGPKLLLHTTSTSGGIINSIENNIPEKRNVFSANLGAYFESMNSGGLVSAGMEAPLPAHLSAKAKATYRNSGNITSPKKTLENTRAELTDITAAISYIRENDVLGASFNAYNTTYGIPGGFVGAHPNGVDIEMERRDATLKYRHHFHDELIDKISVDAARTYYFHTEYEDNGSVGAQFAVRNYSANVFLGINENEFSSGGKAGVFFNARDFDIGGYVFTPPVKSYEYTLYGFQEFSPGRWVFSGGLRYEYHKLIPERNIPNSKIGNITSRDFHVPALSISAMAEIWENYYAGVNLSRGGRAPSIEELYSEGPHLAAYSYETGNPALEAEYGYSAELFSYIDLEKIYLSANIFLNEMPRFIIPRNSGDTNYAQLLPVYSSSAVEARLAGFDLTTQFELTPELNLNLNAAYIHGEDKSENSPLPLIPPFNSAVEIIYDSGNYSFGMKSEYHSAQNRVDKFESPTGDYIIFGGFISGKFILGGYPMSLTLSGENLTNRVYYNHLSRIKEVMPEPGINIRAVMRLFI